MARFTNKLMLDGKRSLAERIIYDAFDAIEVRQKRSPLDVFEQALSLVIIHHAKRISARKNKKYWYHCSY